MAKPVAVDESNFSKFDLGGDYLKSSDLLIDGKFKTFNLTIKEFFPVGSLTGGDGKVVDKPAISFEKASKKMILNATNQEVLHLVSGSSDGTKTPGTKVLIEARVVPAFGELVLGLRIMPGPKTLIRKGLKKQLGLPAVFTSTKPKEEKKDSQDAPSPVPPDSSADPETTGRDG